MTGIKPGFLEKLAQNGVTIPVSFFAGDDGAAGPGGGPGGFGSNSSFRRSA